MKNRILVLSLLLVVSALWGQNAVMDLDQASPSSVFVDVGGGVEQTTFTVSGNLQTLVFLITFSAGNPVVEFVSPTGQTLGLDATNVNVQRTDWGMMVGLATPALGNWALQLSQTLGPGSYDVKSISIPSIPTLALTTPTLAQEPWSSPVAISGLTQPDQAGKAISIMLTTAQTQTTGIVAGQTTVNSDGSFTYMLDPSEFTQGQYFVVASLDEGSNPSIKATAPGSLERTPPDPLPAISNVITIVEQPTTLDVSFANPFGRLPATFHLHVLDSTGTEQVIDLGSETKARLTGFPLGPAQVWLVGVDSLGREGAPSVKSSVTFGTPPVTPPSLTLTQPAVSESMVVGQAPTPVSFALLGNFVSQGPSVDYLQVSIGTTPDGITVQPLTNQWYLPTDSGNLALQVTVTTIAAPGIYTIPVTFSTVGTPTNLVAGTLELTVAYPPLVVTDVSPRSWMVGSGASLTISGNNFFASTEVLLDGTEVPITAFSAQSLSVTAPSTLAAGSHTLTVQMANQSPVNTTLTVSAPNYNLLAYKSISKNLAGTDARFWLGLFPLNGFQGSTQLQISGLPAGWSAQVTPTVATAAQTSVVDVSIPSTTTPGDYDFTATTSEGGQVTLTVSIVAETPDPFISSISTYAAAVADSFWLYGYGFGTASGQVTVSTQSWTVASWSDDLIQVTVPSGAQTGLLRVTLPNGRISNGITFGVKDYGFQFQTGLTTFQVQGGDTKVIPIQLTGYQQPVNLQVQSVNPLVTASIDQSTVTPVGLTNLTLVIDKNIPNGTYAVTLSGSSGNYQTSVGFQVVVGTALGFDTKRVPEVLQATNYAATLTAVNATGTPSFSIMSGVLPQGLTLTPAGLISGRATQAGLFRVVLQVTDSAGHATAKEFKIFVKSTGWYRVGRDAGLASYEPVDSPADSRTLWTGPALGTSTGLLAGANELFVLGPKGITALYPPNGSTLYTINGSFASFQFHDNTLVTLGTDGELSVFETGYGNLIWQRPSITRYWVRAGTILADTGSGQIELLDAGLGTLNASLNGTLTGTLVGWRGQLYQLNATSLELWSDAQGWAQVGSSFPVSLIQAYADGKGLFLVGQDGSVWFWNGSQATVLWTGKVRSMVISPDWLAVDTGTSVEIRDRTSGALLRTLANGDYDELFGAKDKLFGVKGGVLSAINLTWGNTIWQFGSQMFQAVPYGDQVFAVDAQGVVTAFNAPDSVLPPVTTLATVPSVPNGLNGWFITSPQVSLIATDPAVAVASTTWKIDATSWSSYAGTVSLADGVHTLDWYSKNTQGLLEATKSATISVDTQRPVTVATPSIVALAGLPGVWGQPVVLTLSATEAVTGVKETDYRINGGNWQVYQHPVSFQQEGFYTIEFHSQSNAGGWEASQTMPLTLDFEDPTAQTSIQNEQGAQFVFLSGSASVVGLDHLEYKIDPDSAVQTYSQAIAFTATGSWTVEYRAVDKAGRTSAWKTLSVSNQGPDGANAMEDIDYALGSRGRTVEDVVAAGSSIFTNTSVRFLSLPPVLTGATYLSNKDTDGESSAAQWITITFNRSAIVYDLQEPTSHSVLSGWTKLDFIPAGSLSDKYFANGLQMWSKTFQAGDRAIFSGPGLNHVGGDLIFVQAQWSGLVLVAPQPSQAFMPGQSVTFVIDTGLPASNVRWTVRDNALSQTSVGGSSLSYQLSSKDDGGVLSVQESATVGGKVVSTQGTWQVLHQEKMTIVYPNSLVPVRANQKLTPQLVVTDPYGHPETPSQVLWTLNHQGKTVYKGSAPIPLGNSGSYELLATATSNLGQTLGDSTSFQAVDQWPWVKWRWGDKQHQQFRAGLSEGFDKGDADDSQRNVTTKHGNLPVKIWAWQAGAEYQIVLPNGTYEVQLVVGPFNAWDVATVTLNSQAINLMSKTRGEMQSILFVVHVTDGALRITGTEALPFYGFEYRQTDDKTPPSAAVEGPVDNLEDWK